jgi:hypothetical protein
MAGEFGRGLHFKNLLLVSAKHISVKLAGCLVPGEINFLLDFRLAF